MECPDLEFIAEESLITIVPNFSIAEPLDLLTGPVGPFEAGLPLQVPMWLALDLKRRRRCQLKVPDWLEPERLRETIKNEQDSALFTEPPCVGYMEVTQLLTGDAEVSDDIDGGREIKMLVRDLWDLRMAKLKNSMDAFLQSGATHARINHLTPMEISTVRSLLKNALALLGSVNSAGNGAPSSIPTITSSNSQSAVELLRSYLQSDSIDTSTNITTEDIGDSLGSDIRPLDATLNNNN